MSSWSSPADHNPEGSPPTEPAESTAGHAADEVTAVAPPDPWWSEPAEPEDGRLPTMAQLDALSGELDEIDGALASMDTRALAAGAVPDRPDQA